MASIKYEQNMIEGEGSIYIELCRDSLNYMAQILRFLATVVNHEGGHSTRNGAIRLSKFNVCSYGETSIKLTGTGLTTKMAEKIKSKALKMLDANAKSKEDD